jgi:hypothetical protein
LRAAARAQADLFRDVLGNFFRPLAVEPSWRTAAVAGVAKAIYEDYRFEELPVLGDALEEAGCRNQDLLGHCRQPAQHTRGCWVVDLLLNRE